MASLFGKDSGSSGRVDANVERATILPNRVVSQRRFAAPTYDEVDAGTPIHIQTESTEAILRRVSRVGDGAALVWYSGNSGQSERGAIMAYVPVGDSYSPWYTGWAKRQDWELVQPKEISGQEVTSLIGASSQLIQEPRLSKP